MQEFNEVKDSGKRQEFETGSKRDTRDGKGRYDLIPAYALFRLARHYENGAKKYGDHNWQLGQPLSRYLDSLIRHAYRFKDGSRDEDHMAAVAWNAFAYMETEHLIELGQLPQSLNDMVSTVDDIKRRMWRDIPDYYPYQANMLGQIRNAKTGNILKPFLTKWGYEQVDLSLDGIKVRKSVHRLVARAFHGISDLPIDHIDGVKTNNQPHNLRYVTASENAKRAWKLGLKIPTKSGTILDEDDVNVIRKRVEMGEKQRDLAEEYEVSSQTINDIVKMRTWKDGETQE